MPDAMPAWWGGTTPIAVEANGGLVSPMPMPDTIMPGMRWVQLDEAERPVISSSPIPTISRPGPIIQRTGTCDESRPDTVAVTRMPQEMISSRSPVSRALNPRMFWR
jgi:hypothetical protein